jgi:chitin disaccharide deacetylase
MSRRIWLCADDYGIAPGVNAAILDLVEHGRLNATSVMVVAPSFGPNEAAALARLNAGTRRAVVGLHLTLTAPFRPLSPSYRPLRDGAFLSLPANFGRAFLGQLDSASLAAEVEAQLAAFQAAFGRAPDFIDGHQHVHLLLQVREAVLAVCRAHAPAAWVRQCGRASGAAPSLADPKGLLIHHLSRSFARRAAALGVRTNPAFAGSYTFAPAADFARIFPTFLNGLPDGGLIMCHPGFVDDELRRLDPLTDLRESEHAYLASDALPQTLAAADAALAEPAAVPT